MDIESRKITKNDAPTLTNTSDSGIGVQIAPITETATKMIETIATIVDQNLRFSNDFI